MTYLTGPSAQAGQRHPARFKRSRQVGAHFGLTLKRYQSGEKDVSGRISKIGDRSVRTALYEAAHIILTKPVKAKVPKGVGIRHWIGNREPAKAHLGKAISNQMLGLLEAQTMLRLQIKHLGLQHSIERRPASPGAIGAR